MWQQVRVHVFGAPPSGSILLRVSRVIERAFNVVLGEPSFVTRRERMVRGALGITVLLPLVLAGMFFIVLPTALFTIAANNAVPVSLGLVAATFAHSVQHRPLSWLVNARAIAIVLNCFRIAAAVTMLTLAQTAAVRTVRGVRTKMGAAAQRMGIAPETPVSATSDAAAEEMPATKSGNSGATDVLSWFDRSLARVDAAVARADDLLTHAAQTEVAAHEQQQQLQEEEHERQQDVDDKDDVYAHTRGRELRSSSGNQLITEHVPQEDADIQPVEKRSSNGGRGRRHAHRRRAH